MKKLGIVTKTNWIKSGNYNEKRTTTYFLFNEKNELLKKKSFYSNEQSFLKRDDTSGESKSTEVFENAKSAVKHIEYDRMIESFIYKFFGEKKQDWRSKKKSLLPQANTTEWREVDGKMQKFSTLVF